MTWSQIVSEMCRKLEIQVLRNESANSVCSMAIDGKHLREFKRVVRTQAPYIVAEAQMERERQREEAKV